MKKILLGAVLLLSLGTMAQNPTEDKIRTTNFPKMRPIVNSDIPGAPVLSQPKRIDGRVQEIRTEKHGLVYPAFFDWNKDGKKDLILGEFETGETGSFLKVYLNEGTDEEPAYSGEYFYATDVKGDTITNYQWCCIGIHPRFVDLDQDGYLDILSGQYNPGLISWWRGSKEGFLPRQFIEQEGYVEGASLPGEYGDDPTAFNYWNYTSAHFADYDGDGLLDLFVGGGDGMRVALNVGTKEKPKFGLRKYLYHVDGTKLAINCTDEKAWKYIFKTYMTPVDWDGDGVLDLLLTYEYNREGHHPIEFLKGMKTSDGLRFEKAVPLFTEKEGRKAFPGCQPMITVTDYNNDGVQDIVCGISIPTINGFEVAPEIAWEWVDKLRIMMPGKDAGRVLEYLGMEKLQEQLKNPDMRSYYLGKLTDHKYLSLRHRGYVFVMYGSKNPKAAPVAVQVAAAEKVKNVEPEKEEDPFGLMVFLPEIVADKELVVEVRFSIKPGWHAYADNEANREAGFIPMTLELEFPEGVEQVGKVECPVTQLYEGEFSFRQKFVCPKKALEGKTSFMVKARVNYQLCDEHMCMPPKEKVSSGFTML